MGKFHWLWVSGAWPFRMDITCADRDRSTTAKFSAQSDQRSTFNVQRSTLGGVRCAQIETLRSSDATRVNGVWEPRLARHDFDE